MSAVDSFNLGDFLRVREEDENRRRVDSLAGMTLSDILMNEKRVAAAQTQINRTLLDVIRVPEPSSGLNSQNQSHNQNQNQLEKEKRTWKAIKDRLLLLKRSGAVLTSPDIHRQNNVTNLTGSDRRPENPTSGEPISAVVTHRDAEASLSSSRRGATMRLEEHMLLDPTLGSSRRLVEALNDERNLSAREAAAAQEAAREEPAPMEGEQPARMSLMELLEETTERARYDVGDEEEAEEEGGLAAPAADQKCCVCMVRHRGAAFIPCGHTFCRVCSRELFAQRGNCPLCNAQISEVLDIF